MIAVTRLLNLSEHKCAVLSTSHFLVNCALKNQITQHKIQHCLYQRKFSNCQQTIRQPAVVKCHTTTVWKTAL